MGSLHEIPGGRTHTVWDNAIAPVLEVEPGDTVELEVTDASGGQLDRDLEASRAATRAAIAHIVERRDGTVQEAYALASVACDLRIHEVVDVPNWVVGCFVPDSLFEGRA